MPDDLEAFDNVEVSEVGPSSLPSQADVDRAALKAALERLTALEKRVDELSERVQGISAVDQVQRRFRKLRQYLAIWLRED